MQVHTSGGPQQHGGSQESRHSNLQNAVMTNDHLLLAYQLVTHFCCLIYVIQFVIHTEAQSLNCKHESTLIISFKEVVADIYKLPSVFF